MMTLRYEFNFLVAKTIFISLATIVCKYCFSHLKVKFCHIFALQCNILSTVNFSKHVQLWLKNIDYMYIHENKLQVHCTWQLLYGKKKSKFAGILEKCKLVLFVLIFTP